MAPGHPQHPRAPLPSGRTGAHLVYALHTVASVVGIVGAATVVGSVLGSLPSIVAVILHSITRGDARGTWVASHHRWQIRTCWCAALWALMGWGLSLTRIGAVVGVPLLLALTRWLPVSHRVRKACTAFSNGDTSSSRSSKQVT